MKTKFLLALCAVAFFAVACGGNEPIVPEVPEEEEKAEKPLFDMHAKHAELIVMRQSDDGLYETSVPVDKIEAKILGGSGGYKIIYPEEIFCKYWGDESEPMVPYSEDILKVWVEENILHVKRVIPAYNPNGSGEELWLEASFILEDSKGQQRPFNVKSMFVF